MYDIFKFKWLKTLVVVLNNLLITYWLIENNYSHKINFKINRDQNSE